MVEIEKIAGGKFEQNLIAFDNMLRWLKMGRLCGE